MESENEEFKVQNVFYSKTKGGNYAVYMVPNHYANNLGYIKEALKYAKTIGCKFEEDGVRIQQLAGERYRRMTSIEFTSETEPATGTLLLPDSCIWQWLVTP